VWVGYGLIWLLMVDDFDLMCMMIVLLYLGSWLVCLFIVDIYGIEWFVVLYCCAVVFVFGVSVFDLDW